MCGGMKSLSGESLLALDALQFHNLEGIFIVFWGGGRESESKGLLEHSNSCRGNKNDPILKNTKSFG